MKSIAAYGLLRSAHVQDNRPQPSDPPAPTPIGCFRDQGENTGTRGRDLDGFYMESSSLTTAMCINACRQRGFAYAGTQFSSHCFCGHNYGEVAPPTTATCAAAAAPPRSAAAPGQTGSTGFSDRNTNGVGVDFPGVSSAQIHGVVGPEQQGSPGPCLTIACKRPPIAYTRASLRLSAAPDARRSAPMALQKKPHEFPQARKALPTRSRHGVATLNDGPLHAHCT